MGRELIGWLRCFVIHVKNNSVVIRSTRGESGERIVQKARSKGLLHRSLLSEGHRIQGFLHVFSLHIYSEAGTLMGWVYCGGICSSGR